VLVGAGVRCRVRGGVMGRSKGESQGRSEGGGVRARARRVRWARRNIHRMNPDIQI
jgi:hypothetical protein